MINRKGVISAANHAIITSPMNIFGDEYMGLKRD